HHDLTAPSSLSPRDIQARIRSGDSADDVARVAGVPVDRVLRYAGPVLQERAMLAQHARRTKLKTSDKGASLADVVDARLAQHGTGDPMRGGHEPMRPAADTARRESRPGRGLGGDPIRSGRDALLATLDRPLDGPGAPRNSPAAPAAAERQPVRGGAAALLGS